MQLRTKCDGCYFKGNEGPCSLEKRTFDSEIGQFTMGFCQHKRTQKWSEKYVDLSYDEKLEVIEKEEKLLTIIIKSTDNNLKKVYKTMANLAESVIDETSVLVIFNKLDITKINELVEKFADFKGLKWQIENYTIEDDNYSSPLILDVTLRLVETSWFMYLEAGDKIKPGTIGMLRANVGSPNNSYVCYYFENDDKIITTKEAFLHMDGNYDGLWFEKVKEFENWKEICKCIH